MLVKLLHATPLEVADIAIAQCYDKPHDVNNVNRNRIKRVAVVNKHASTIEHINYSFFIQGISRALLQQVARHRIASYTVESTRYTLKKLKNISDKDLDMFLVKTGNAQVDEMSKLQLAAVKDMVLSGVKNDVAKYALPESYKTKLVMTINARSLTNLFELRTDKHAMEEFRKLAHAMFEELPEDHKYLFEEVVYG